MAGFAGRVQDYLLHAAQTGREVIAVPPFVVTVDPSTDLRYLNYAIPAERGAAASAAAALGVLRAEMRDRGRLPRLEFVREAAECLDSVLLAGGFVEESSLPLMTCSPEELTQAPDVPGLRVEVLTRARRTSCCPGSPPPRRTRSEPPRARAPSASASGWPPGASR